MRCLVLGGGGFIGGHLVRRLREQGMEVFVADLIYNKEVPVENGHYFQCDLSSDATCVGLFCFGPRYDAVFNLAADMGGAGYIFSGKHDAELMTNSAKINLNVAKFVQLYCPQAKVFYSSSACMYPAHIQEETNNPGLKESDAYPAMPDSEYGWEKLFSERLYLAYARNYGLNVRIARFHNIYGPMGTYDGGREKAPAAICRKVAMAPDGGEIEIWGDGHQTRSFLYIDDCLDGIESLMRSECKEPVNIGSEDMVSISDLAKITMAIAGKTLSLKHIDGPLGVRGRNSNNDFCRKMTGWQPKITLQDGIEHTYKWIESQVKRAD